MLRAHVAAGLETGLSASALSEQLRRGFRGLRFEATVEAAFREEQFRDGLKYLRINLVILVAIVFTIVQLDFMFNAELARGLPYWLRLGVMVPILSLAFALTFLRRAGIWYPRIVLLLAGIALVGVAWLVLRAWSFGADMLLRLVLVTIATWFVLGLPFRSAGSVNLFALAFYAAVAAAREMPTLEQLHHLAMLLMTNVVCAAGAYNLERLRRIAWLEGRLLAETAMQDGLTGIGNRRRFDEHLERVWHQALRDHKAVSLLLVDIDHFKAYNDHYGHQAGDEAMKTVAATLARFARRPLDLAARYGGEEFAILLFDAGLEPALRMAEEILEAVRQLAIPHAASDAAPALTVSIGVACVVPISRRSSAGLVQLADQALYAAKDAGRDRLRSMEHEYEHMKTGYFHRRALKDAQ